MNFDRKELLFGAYALMGCPTKMIPPSVLLLKYPAGNRGLFYALTAYGVCIGAAMAALKHVPDIPFFFIGLAALVLIMWSGRGEKRKGNEQDEENAN